MPQAVSEASRSTFPVGKREAREGVMATSRGIRHGPVVPTPVRKVPSSILSLEVENMSNNYWRYSGLLPVLELLRYWRGLAHLGSYD